MEYSINGIQQIGVGTMDFHKSWKWYIKNFGFDVKALEDDTVAERMLPYTGGVPQKRHACIALNLNGGGGLEIWQYSDRKPVPPAHQVMVGDIGIFAARLKCRDLVDIRIGMEEDALGRSEVSCTPDKTPCFYFTDPAGNIFQIVQDGQTYIRQRHPCGGVTGAMIGVTDMERAISFYCDVLGYDAIKYDVSGVQKDWTGLPGGEENYRRVLLYNEKEPQGAFSGLFGSNTIELVQALDRTPSRIYEGRFWGDPGFIQVCYDVTGMDAFGRFCASKGHPFTVDSCPGGEIFDMGDASGRFTYIEDPDGTLIEFVETRKVPVAKKFGWFIDMTKRNPAKPLPKFLFRAMGLMARQK